MKILYTAGAAMVALAIHACPASAQQPPVYQWCAVDSEGGDIASCIYVSLQQCLQSFNQTAGICYENMVAPPVQVARPKKARSRSS